MTTVERIDQIYDKMQSGVLSGIIPMLLPIALECKDYEGYCVLSYWSYPVQETKVGNMAWRTEIRKILMQEGLNNDEVAQIELESSRLYVRMRLIEEEKVMALSAKEMEDHLRAFDDLYKATNVPDGLTPADLYFRSERAIKEKTSIIKNRKCIEKQYAVLQSYIMGKLAEYRQRSSQNERKKELSQSIKNTKDVFIIHGHNEAKLLELEKLLKEEFDLNPIILKDKPNQGMTIIDKFEKYALQCSYAFALFTPDDIVTGANGKQYFQARPNVIFELGWFYANLGRSRVCILEQASDKSEIFSDLQGIMRIQFNSSIEEVVIGIRRELQSVGII